MTESQKYKYLNAVDLPDQLRQFDVAELEAYADEVSRYILE